jgi:hypothetical protein
LADKDKDKDDWTPAKETLERVAALEGNERVASTLLHEKAQAGDIKTRARRVKRGSGPGRPWLVDEALTPDDWYAAQVNWQVGSFFRHRHLRPGRMAIERVEAHGIVFEAAGLRREFFAVLSSSAKAEAECRGWLRSLAKKSPDRKPKSKAELQREAKERWPQLSGGAFDRCWQYVIDKGAQWDAPGAPRKSPH